MENITIFKYEDVEKILRAHVIKRTMDSMLIGMDITASAPYGDYKVTISEKLEPEEKEGETDGPGS